MGSNPTSSAKSQAIPALGWNVSPSLPAKRDREGRCVSPLPVLCKALRYGQATGHGTIEPRVAVHVPYVCVPFVIVTVTVSPLTDPVNRAGVGAFDCGGPTLLVNEPSATNAPRSFTRGRVKEPWPQPAAIFTDDPVTSRHICVLDQWPSASKTAVPAPGSVGLLMRPQEAASRSANSMRSEILDFIESILASEIT